MPVSLPKIRMLKGVSKNANLIISKSAMNTTFPLNDKTYIKL